jgi:hypothetical protein
MEQPIEFGDADAHNLELVRQVVLHRLKEDTSFQNMNDFRFQKYVTSPEHRHRDRFSVLVREVMWELVAQGVISPGSDSANPDPPWFHVTEYGRKVLAAERFLPHDPGGYITDIKKVSKACVTDVTLAFLEEALRCFTRGCHVASVLLLGVAAESVFLNFCTLISRSVKDPNEQKKLDDSVPVKQKHRWVSDKYEALPSKTKRERLPESLDTTLTSLYDLIRRQRNDLGHPTSLPRLDRDHAFVFFKLFPTYVADVEAFAEYCESSGL